MLAFLLSLEVTFSALCVQGSNVAPSVSPHAISSVHILKEGNQDLVGSTFRFPEEGNQLASLGQGAAPRPSTVAKRATEGGTDSTDMAAEA